MNGLNNFMLKIIINSTKIHMPAETYFFQAHEPPCCRSLALIMACPKHLTGYPRSSLSTMLIGTCLLREYTLHQIFPNHFFQEWSSLNPILWDEPCGYQHMENFQPGSLVWQVTTSATVEDHKLICLWNGHFFDCIVLQVYSHKHSNVHIKITFFLGIWIFSLSNSALFQDAHW